MNLCVDWKKETELGTRNVLSESVEDDRWSQRFCYPFNHGGGFDLSLWHIYVNLAELTLEILTNDSR